MGMAAISSNNYYGNTANSYYTTTSTDTWNNNPWTTGKNGDIYIYNTSTDSTSTYTSSGVTLQVQTSYRSPRIATRAEGAMQVGLGTEAIIQLPDGTKIDIKKDGSYKILDKDAKVTYQQNPAREFNKFVNASDILEDFVRYLGTIGARQKDVMEVPIEVFIHWLIIEAAKADGDEPPEEVKLLPSSTKHTCRCKYCGRFITKEKFNLGINFCTSMHLEKFMNKKGVVYEKEEEEICTEKIVQKEVEKQYVTISAIH